MYKRQDTDSYTNGQDFTANLKVTLSKEVKKIDITAPSKTKYEHYVDEYRNKITLKNGGKVNMKNK